MEVSGTWDMLSNLQISLLLLVIYLSLLCDCPLSRFICVQLCDPMDCSLPGSSVHGILQARILEWVAISYSRGSSPLRDPTGISSTAGGFFSAESQGKLCKYFDLPPIDKQV